MAHNKEINAFLTFHTYSQLWLHPFGHKRNNYPADISDLVCYSSFSVFHLSLLQKFYFQKDTATLAAAAVRALYGTRYTVGSGADTLCKKCYRELCTVVKLNFLIVHRCCFWRVG